MKLRMKPWVFASAVLAFGLAGMAWADGRLGGIEGVKTGRTNRDEGEKKPSRYIVVQVRNTDGSVSFEVIGSTETREKQKSLREQYEKEAKEWRERALEAKKHKEKLTEKPPVEPVVRRFGDSSYKTEEQAREIAGKLQERWDQKMAKKTGEDGGEKKGEGERKAEGEKKRDREGDR